MRKSKIGRKYGYRVDHPNLRDTIYRPKIARMETQLPLTSENLLEKLPSCWDQEQEGSCTGHGVGAAVAFLHPGFMPSRQEIYYNGRAIEGDTDQDSGAQISDVLTGVANNGVAPENLWPYVESNIFEVPPENVVEAGSAYKISQFSRISGLEDLKNCLAEGFPVVIGFSVYDNFESQEMADSGILTLPGPNDELLGGHCVLVGQYDDITKRCFIRNSWGENWGPFKGNFYMSYSYFNQLVSDLWVIQS